MEPLDSSTDDVFQTDDLQQCNRSDKPFNDIRRERER